MSRRSILELASRRRLPTPSIPFERFELACGATLLVSVHPGAPVTAVDAHVRGGPSLDRPGLAGTSFLVGGLTDQGTAEHDETAIAALLEPAGGEISGEAKFGGAAVDLPERADRFVLGS